MKQIEFKITTWGGKRKKAGRKNKTATVNHMKREQVQANYPLHITMRVKKGLNSLRGPNASTAFKIALGKAKKKGLRVIHFALESNHLHLFAEASDNAALRAGAASFGASFGRAIARLNRRRGSVFVGRYHLRVLKSPRQTKNTLAYVLLNHSRHEGSVPYPDERSSAEYFGEWCALIGPRYRDLRVEWLPNYLSAAQSWLGRLGWRRAG